MRLVDGEYVEKVDNVSDIAQAMVASSAPMYPPKAWFDNPSLDRLTPITITADGRVYGHIADWNRDHIGLPNSTRPPHSANDYGFFKTGAIKTAEGDEVAIGNLTLAGGHAPLNASAGEAVEHYDDTASAVADVNVGEDAHGIWISGGLRPGVDENAIRALRASAPSGDWRPINGNLELVAICQVNTPGFPIARAMVASGEMSALVAAGASRMYELQQERFTLESLQHLEGRVSSLESVVAGGPKKRWDDAPKSDNASDPLGDDSASGQKDQGEGSNAGSPVEDTVTETKEDVTEVNNDGELDSNKGSVSLRKPKLPGKKKPLAASAAQANIRAVDEALSRRKDS